MAVVLAVTFIWIIATMAEFVSELDARYRLGNSIELNRYATYREVQELEGLIGNEIDTAGGGGVSDGIAQGSDLWTLNMLAGFTTAVKLLLAAPGLARAVFDDAIAITGLSATALMYGLVGAVVAYLVLRKIVERVVGKI